MLPKPLRETAELLRQLPQIGPRQAGRLALYLFRNAQLREQIKAQLANLSDAATLCNECFRIAETSPCLLCADKSRESALLAVVEEDTDLEQLEATHSYRGKYFVLGGRFNPNRGAPENQSLRIAELKQRLSKDSGKLKEVVIAMNPTVEGDMLALALMHGLKEYGIKLTRLGRGLPVGGEIEYADEETLRSALEHRS